MVMTKTSGNRSPSARKKQAARAFRTYPCPPKRFHRPIALLKNAQLMDDSEARKYLKENTDYPISKSPLNLEDIDPDVDDVLNGNE